MCVWCNGLGWVSTDHVCIPLGSGPGHLGGPDWLNDPIRTLPFKPIDIKPIEVPPFKPIEIKPIEVPPFKPIDIKPIEVLPFKPIEIPQTPPTNPGQASSQSSGCAGFIVLLILAAIVIWVLTTYGFPGQ